MLETINSFNNTPINQLAVNAIYNQLLKGIKRNLKAKLFSVFAFDYIISNWFLTNKTILSNISKCFILNKIEKGEQIYKNQEYGWNK